MVIQFTHDFLHSPIRFQFNKTHFIVQNTLKLTAGIEDTDINWQLAKDEALNQPHDSVSTSLKTWSERCIYQAKLSFKYFCYILCDIFPNDWLAPGTICRSLDGHCVTKLHDIQSVGLGIHRVFSVLWHWSYSVFIDLEITVNSKLCPSFTHYQKQ